MQTIIENGRRLIPPTAENMTFMGRISFIDDDAPEFYWPYSNVRIRFKGTYIGAVIRNKTIYNKMSVGCTIDGIEKCISFDTPDGEYLLTLAEGLEDTEHEAVFFKRQDASHFFAFMGFVLDEGAEVLPVPELPEFKIEVFGDSVCAGAVTEAVANTGMLDPEDNDGSFDNAWQAFPAITARALNAQLHDTSQGGIAVFNGTGYYHGPDFIGMESAYDKLCMFPEGTHGVTEWDFTRYIPDVVIFEVGQNDCHCETDINTDITDPVYRRKWKSRYKDIILSLQKHYPKAKFILLLTILCHDPEWDKAVEEISAELDDENIVYFRFTRTGRGTPGHPRIPEQCEMADELTAYISSMI